MATTDRLYTQATRVLEIEDLVRKHEPIAIEDIAVKLRISVHIKTLYRDIAFLERRRRVSLDRETKVVMLPTRPQ